MRCIPTSGPSVPFIPTALACHAQQRERLDADQSGQALDAPEAEVALAALDAAQVGVVKRERLREHFLGLAERFSMRPQVATHESLQFPFHAANARGLLLDSLQTNK
jgi:hypothetical protein